MAKTARRPPEQRPPPLPPETRTVGQLVAETLRFYGRNFFHTLPLGLSVTALTQLTVAFGDRHVRTRGHPPAQAFEEPASLLGGGVEMTVLIGALLLTMSYIVAIVLVTGARPDLSEIVTAYGAGLLVFLPVPLLAQLFVLPAVAYLALVGWVVPVAIVEGSGLLASFGRSIRLARADFVHAAGGLATLVIVFYVTRLMMALLLRSGAESTERVAAGLSDLVLAPVLFVGSAFLYLDQAARAKARQ
jgi:ABC-type amino acid transport system permease subunit